MTDLSKFFPTLKTVKVQPEPSTASAIIKAALDSSIPKESPPPITSPILGGEEPLVTDLSPVEEHLANIERILAKEKLPIATLRSALRSVMKYIADNPDTILELEPEQKSQIVKGYIRQANEEVAAVLTKKKATPKSKKPAKSAELKDFLASLNESADDEDIDGDDFL